MILDDADKPGELPITIAPFPKPASTATLFWKGDEEENIYQAFVVQMQELQGDLLTFQFVHKDTAEVRPGTHTIDLRHANIVFRRLPSTIETAAKGQCGFLFLRRNEAPATLVAGMADAGGGTGKYPRSAGAEEDFVRLAHRLLELAFSMRQGHGEAKGHALQKARTLLAELAEKVAAAR